MTQIALLGAGGKMGYRLSLNLKNSDYKVKHVEVSDVGRDRLKNDLGITCCDMDDALGTRNDGNHAGSCCSVCRSLAGES